MAGLHDFFTYQIIKSADATIEAQIELNPAHALYEGHFPGNPVVPGVCQVHIVKTILSNYFGRKVTMAEAKDVKFLSMIQPQTMNLLSCEIMLQQLDEQRHKVTARLNHGETTCMRLRATFNFEEEK